MYLAGHATAKGLYLQISGCDVKLSERYIQIQKNKGLEQMAFFYSTEPNDMEAC